jgi:hypothetical protein
MKSLWQTLFQRLTSTLRERVHLALTTMALRHQLAVLQRSAKRPRFWPADRCLRVLLSIVWARWPEALEIVQADTVRRWRRQGWWHHLRWSCGWKRPGRPAIASEMRTLIRRMSRENVLWGAPRIHGELAKLGVRVSRTTIAKYMARRPGPPSATWRTFLRWYGHDLVASGAYAELIRRLYALSVQVIHAFQRWLASLTPRGTQQSARRDVISPIQLSLTVFRPNLRAQGTVDRVRVPVRSPPDPQRLCSKDPEAADVPRAVEAAHVRLAA